MRSVIAADRHGRQRAALSLGRGPGAPSLASRPCWHADWLPALPNALFRTRECIFNNKMAALKRALNGFVQEVNSLIPWHIVALNRQNGPPWNCSRFGFGTLDRYSSSRHARFSSPGHRVAYHRPGGLSRKTTQCRSKVRSSCSCERGVHCSPKAPLASRMLLTLGVAVVHHEGGN